MDVFWQGRRESNPRQRFWKPSSYHWTTPLWLANGIIQESQKLERRNIPLTKFKKTCYIAACNLADKALRRSHWVHQPWLSLLCVWPLPCAYLPSAIGQRGESDASWNATLLGATSQGYTNNLPHVNHGTRAASTPQTNSTVGFCGCTHATPIKWSHPSQKTWTDFGTSTF